MKTPGQSSSQSNVVKPAPLDFSPELLRSLRLPAGFKIEKFAEGLKTPRVIVVGPNGGLYVSSRDEGTITFLSDRGGAADGGRIVLQKPNVHGIAVREGELFYITIREIFAAPIAADGSIGTERRIASDLPDAGQHPNRTMAFGLDGFLYVSVGSTCNDCEENNPENATLLKMRPDGTGREIVASGLRNTIGFAWEPRSGALYGLDNGVDTYGDDEQPEEFNRIEPGKTYGWPFILGAGMKHPLREPKNGTSMIGTGTVCGPLSLTPRMLHLCSSCLPTEAISRPNFGPMPLPRCTAHGIANRRAGTRSSGFDFRMESPQSSNRLSRAFCLIKGTDDGRDLHVRLDWSSPGTAAC